MTALALLIVGVVALVAGYGRRPFLMAVGIVSCFGAYLAVVASLAGGDPISGHIATLVAQLGGAR